LTASFCFGLLPIGPFGGASSGIHEAANRNVPHGLSCGAINIMFLEAIMAIGTVKWFNAQKGFGFIQPDNGTADVFVHISAVERAGMSGLAEGQKLSFEVVSERGKSAASNLQTV
jgi:cold shock protein